MTQERTDPGTSPPTSPPGRLEPYRSRAVRDTTAR